MPLPTTRAIAAAVVVSLLGLDWIVQGGSVSSWTYLVFFGAPPVDAALPVAPPATVSITPPVTVVTGGGLWVILVILSAALGGVIGDNACYLLGRKVGEPATRRLFSGKKSRERLEWARRVIHRHGPVMVVAARFVPGGRTALTFASGTVGWPWRPFIAADVTGAVLWATYMAMLGYMFGQTFTQTPWLAILVSLIVAGVVALIGEVIRQVRSRDESERGDAERESGEAAEAAGT